MDDSSSSLCDRSHLYINQGSFNQNSQRNSNFSINQYIYIWLKPPFQISVANPMVNLPFVDIKTHWRIWWMVSDTVGLPHQTATVFLRGCHQWFATIHHFFRFPQVSIRRKSSLPSFAKPQTKPCFFWRSLLGEKVSVSPCCQPVWLWWASAGTISRWEMVG